jgi:hypothetical protein
VQFGSGHRTGLFHTDLVKQPAYTSIYEVTCMFTQE